MYAPNEEKNGKRLFTCLRIEQKPQYKISTHNFLEDLVLIFSTCVRIYSSLFLHNFSRIMDIKFFYTVPALVLGGPNDT